ncbi:anaphase-promoting complex subunit cdc27 [Modicella reniformis]|uniref:Anaphase-promoting complex subunit cdc27 n=1 Tax=Modicella reniformis TaxID=1440133 RepID=A0A9P6INW2_9FUNG|nr:anaphase-promoting complex subunit cdc27 [Modicella reniformis]
MAGSMAPESSGTFPNSVPKLEAPSQRLDHLIRYSLDKCQLRSAVFLAERLLSQLRGPGHSHAEREYAQYLLALSHYRQGKPETAWAVLEGSKSPRCQYLFAQCALDLRRYVECNGILEQLLEDTTLAWCSTADMVLIRSGTSGFGDPDRSSVLNLLGHNARAQQRHKLAVKYYKEALELNPFLWEAFENLCELGIPPDPNSMFSQFDVRVTSMPQRSLLSTIQRSRAMNIDTPVFSTFRNDSDHGDMM